MFQVTTLLPSDASKAVPRTPAGLIDYGKDFFGKPTMLTVSGQLQVISPVTISNTTCCSTAR